MKNTPFCCVFPVTFNMYLKSYDRLVAMVLRWFSLL